LAFIAVAPTLSAISCREPTQLKLEITSPMSCDELDTAAIDVGGDAKTLEDRALDAPSAVAGCIRTNGRAEFGHIFLVPGRSSGAVIVRAATRGTRPEQCTKENGYRGCIVARRRFSYVDHATLTMTVQLDRSCIDVPCNEESTCDKGRCIAAQVLCQGSSCDTDPDAGVDAGPRDAGPADAGPTDATLVDATEVDASPIDDAEVPDRVIALAAGLGSTCALFKRGGIKCWGDNTYGQLGLGDNVSRGTMPGQMGAALPFVDLGAPAKQVSVGATHACALLDDGKVKCWGSNADGQLGLGGLEARRAPTDAVSFAVPARQVACGADHTCALLDSQQVVCWGRNTSGQLGVGDTTNRGNSGTPPSVPALGLSGVAGIGLGANHSCAILGNGQLKCWGQNTFGQLGLGDTQIRVGGIPNAIPPVNLGANSAAGVVNVTGGDLHTCALLDGGAVKCWGYNGSGALGLGDTQQRGQLDGTMGDNLPALQLPSAFAVGCGKDLSCALVETDKVRCWGYNENGQLGLGDTITRNGKPGTPNLDLGSNFGTIGSMATGRQHACAVSSGTVKCWGANSTGALGLGDTNNRGDKPGQMGDNLPPVVLR